MPSLPVWMVSVTTFGNSRSVLASLIPKGSAASKIAPQIKMPNEESGVIAAGPTGIVANSRMAGGAII